jgi:hypothetical protein
VTPTTNCGPSASRPYGAWHSPGTSLALAWHSPGTSLALAWHSPGTSLALAWHSPGTSLALAWHLAGTRLALRYFRNAEMWRFRNCKSAGLLAAPAVWPQSDGMGANATWAMNCCS